MSYLCGFIRDDESKRDWLQDRVATCKKKISVISESAGKYTQESYAAVAQGIQYE